jgi:hypothetical protein
MDLKVLQLESVSSLHSLQLTVKFSLEERAKGHPHGCYSAKGTVLRFTEPVSTCKHKQFSMPICKRKMITTSSTL